MNVFWDDCLGFFSSLGWIASLATILVALMVSYFVLCSSGLELISRVSRYIGLESGYQGVIVKFPIELVLCTSRWPIGFGNLRSIKLSWMFFIERYWQIAFVGSPRRLERSHPKILQTDNFCQMWHKDLALQALVTLWASSWSNAKSDCYGFTDNLACAMAIIFSEKWELHCKCWKPAETEYREQWITLNWDC